jgi:hypothetical protein
MKGTMNQPQEATLTRATKVLIDLKEFDLAFKIMELIAAHPNDSPSLSVVTTPDPVAESKTAAPVDTGL